MELLQIHHIYWVNRWWVRVTMGDNNKMATGTKEILCDYQDLGDGPPK